MLCYVMLRLWAMIRRPFLEIELNTTTVILSNHPDNTVNIMPSKNKFGNIWSVCAYPQQGDSASGTQTQFGPLPLLLVGCRLAHC